MNHAPRGMIPYLLSLSVTCWGCSDSDDKGLPSTDSGLDLGSIDANAGGSRACDGERAAAGLSAGALPAGVILYATTSASTSSATSTIS